MEFDKICRLCGANSNKVMYNVFDKDANGQQIIQLIKQCLPILIYRTDPLSKYICIPCNSKLSEYSSFRNKTIQTNDQFKTNLSDKLHHSDVKLYLNSLENAYENDNIQVGYYRTILPVKNCASQVTIETTTNYTNTITIEEIDIDEKPTLSSLTILTPSKINELSDEISQQPQQIEPAERIEQPELIEQPRKKRRIAGPKSKTRYLNSPDRISPPPVQNEIIQTQLQNENLPNIENNELSPLQHEDNPDMPNNEYTPLRVYTPNMQFNEYATLRNVNSPHIQKSEFPSIPNATLSKISNNKPTSNSDIEEIESPPTLLQFALKQINYNINIPEKMEYKTDPDNTEYMNHNSDYTEYESNNTHSDNMDTDNTEYNNEYSNNTEFERNMEYTTNSDNTPVTNETSSVHIEQDNSDKAETNLETSSVNTNENPEHRNLDNLNIQELNTANNSDNQSLGNSGNADTFNNSDNTLNLDNPECSTHNLNNPVSSTHNLECNVNSDNPDNMAVTPNRSDNTDGAIANLVQTELNSSQTSDDSILYKLLESNSSLSFTPIAPAPKKVEKNVLSSNYMNYDINLDEPAICNYCNRSFVNILQLSRHELSHIKVDLGGRVDSKWQSKKIANLYTDYLKRLIAPEKTNSTTSDTGTSDEDSLAAESLLIPEPEDDDVDYFNVVNNVVLLKGQPIRSIEKLERRKYYKDVVIGGVKRKLCTICRHTFKDSWAMENHYFSDVCQYTCKFCGRKFKFQKELFQAHLKLHEGEPTNKIFGPRDRKMKGKKKKYHTQRQIMINQALPPKVKPIKIKTLMQKRLNEGYPVKIKTEPGLEDNSVTLEASSSKNDSYQAFFCRKCFKVFFQVEQYNVHVKLCIGDTLMTQETKIATEPKQTAPKPDTRMITRNLNSRISTSKRPVRSCVKDIHLNTDSDVDSGDNYPAKKSPSKSRTSITGFDCTICCSSFPTKHSRNSHMRIHKGHNQTPKTPLNKVAPKSHAIAKVEPKVIPKIAKGENNFNLNSTVARLVHNNPHLTIRSYTKADATSPQGPSERKVETPTSDQAKKYKCADCNGRFENKSVLYYHKVNSCVIKRHYECAFCRKKFGSYEQYHSHMLFVHPE